MNYCINGNELNVSSLSVIGFISLDYIDVPDETGRIVDDYHIGYFRCLVNKTEATYATLVIQFN